MANKELFEKAREALLSHAVLVPSIEERIEERKRKVAVAKKTAKKIEILSSPATMPVFTAMKAHCAKREARQMARKKV